ncbi:Ankyrin repeat-containing protein 26 [Elsinoe fawcettii]|nr:Ankyrin repeat-containing protein 26 [Elsinoe fawcettii]
MASNKPTGPTPTNTKAPPRTGVPDVKPPKYTPKADSPVAPSAETILLQAVSQGNEDSVRYALEKGASRDIYHPDTKLTPLMLSARNGNERIARLLLDKFASKSLKSPEGLTAAQIALSHGKANVLGLLLRRGAKMECQDSLPTCLYVPVARKGDVNCLDALHANKVWLTCSHTKTDSVMHVAIKAGQAEFVKLLAKGEPRLVTERNHQGYEPLHTAVRHKRIEEMNTLRNYGASTRSKAEGMPVLHHAILAGDKSIIRSLKERGVEMEGRSDANETALYTACRKGLLDMVELLLSLGASSHTTGPEGQTPFTVACVEGHLVVATFLRDKYTADIEARNKNGITPFQMAYFKRKEQIVKWLIQVGANVDARFADGSTVLHAYQSDSYTKIAAIVATRPRLCIKNNKGDQPLHSAIRAGNLEMVKTFIKAGAPATYQRGASRRVLGLAAEYGKCDIANVLLDAGDSIKGTSFGGMTPLHHAARAQKCDMIRWLKARGAEAGAEATVNSKPRPALHMAAEEGLVESARALIDPDNPTSVELKNSLGETPLLVALLSTNPAAKNTTDLLRRRGANIDARSNEGLTALFAAAKQGRVATVQDILKRGADPHAIPDKGSPFKTWPKTDSVNLILVAQAAKPKLPPPSSKQAPGQVPPEQMKKSESKKKKKKKKKGFFGYAYEVMAPVLTHRREQYVIAIVCALHLEKTAVMAMLDEIHQDPMHTEDDDNHYTSGRIGDHNVIVVCLPAGSMGKSHAAVAATQMTRSFRIKMALLVGVGGGVPSKTHDVRLGDVVVSQPSGKFGGLVEWDFGKTERDGIFSRTGSLNRPPTALLNALSALRARHNLHGDNLGSHLQSAAAKYSRIATTSSPPADDPDQLFCSDYDHIGDGLTCVACDTSRLQNRPPRSYTGPFIHYGLIASGDQVMRHGRTRDKHAAPDDVICFEMEAAGVATVLPCLVIRGICDYADSHKNKRWQEYAAATAAAFAKELLLFLQRQYRNPVKADHPDIHRPTPAETVGTYTNPNTDEDREHRPSSPSSWVHPKVADLINPDPVPDDPCDDDGHDLVQDQMRDSDPTPHDVESDRDLPNQAANHPVETVPHILPIPASEDSSLAKLVANDAISGTSEGLDADDEPTLKSDHPEDSMLKEPKTLIQVSVGPESLKSPRLTGTPTAEPLSDVTEESPISRPTSKIVAELDSVALAEESPIDTPCAAPPLRDPNQGSTDLEHEPSKDSHLDTDVNAGLLCSATDGDVNLLRRYLNAGAKINTRQVGTRMTPLILASKNGHSAIVRLLLDSGPKLKLRDSEGNTAVLHAVTQQHAQILDMLLGHLSSTECPHSKTTDGVVLCPWTDAVKFGNVEVAQVLLSRGITANCSLKNGDSIAHIASEQKQPRILDLLLTSDPTLCNIENDSGQTPLHLAAGLRESTSTETAGGVDAANDRDLARQASNSVRSVVTEIIDMLMRSGANLDARTGKGLTPLHSACFAGSVEAAGLLLNHGADIEAVTQLGRTSLHVAAAQAHVDVVHLLIDRKANLEAQQPKSGTTPLLRAIATNSLEAVTCLLVRGANANTKRTDDGNSCLHYAAQKDMEGAIAPLIKYGAKVAACNKEKENVIDLISKLGRIRVADALWKCARSSYRKPQHLRSALNKAVESDRHEMLKWIIKKASVSGTEAKAIGSTALMLAIEKRNTERIDKLIKAGVPVEARNTKGRTALYCAYLHADNDWDDYNDDNRWNVVRNLLKNGADIDQNAQRGPTILFEFVKRDHVGTVERVLKDGADPRKIPHTREYRELFSKWIKSKSVKLVLAAQKTY